MERITLLDQALQLRNHPWHREPIIWLSNQVFLHNSHGAIFLSLVGYPAECAIFWLDQELGTWYALKDGQHRYNVWAEYARIWVEMKAKGAANA